MDNSHINYDLYKVNPEMQAKQRELMAQAQSEFDQMVHAALLGARGKELYGYLVETLKEPVFTTGSTTEEMLIREGGRLFCKKLVDSFNRGAVKAREQRTDKNQK